MLFGALVLVLVLAARAERWGAKQIVISLISALLPFGAFWLERRLRAPSQHSA